MVLKSQPSKSKMLAAVVLVSLLAVSGLALPADVTPAGTEDPAHGAHGTGLEPAQEPQRDQKVEEAVRNTLAEGDARFQRMGPDHDAPWAGQIQEAPIAVRADGFTVATPAPLTVLFPGLAARIVGERPSGSTFSAYVGDDPADWIEGAPRYASLRYVDVHDGIDIRLHSDGGHLEFDHVLAPGTEATDARFMLPGAADLRVAEDGSLFFRLDGKTFSLAPPHAYQEGPGGRVTVASAYRLLPDGSVGYTVGTYDPARPLVIDPVLKHSTFFGGGNYEYTRAIEVIDPAISGQPYIRHVYVAGYMYATPLPSGWTTVTASAGSSYDAFVAKYAYDLRDHSLDDIFLALVGSSGAEYVQDLDLAGDGTSYLVGYTSGTDLPTPDAPVLTDPTTGLVTFDGGTNGGGTDAFILKLDATGNLLFGTYLGSASTDYGYAVAADDAGRVLGTGYVTMCHTYTSPFPIVNAAQPQWGGFTSSTCGYDA